MPRPDLSLLGVSYRRIPVLSIGRDVYLDTRLILQKLEALYPASAAHPGISGASGAGNPEHTALEQLISARTIDAQLFKNLVQCVPAGTFSDPAFLRDRAALNGVDVDRPGAVSPFAPEVVNRARPEALAVAHRWVRWFEEVSHRSLFIPPFWHISETRIASTGIFRSCYSWTASRRARMDPGLQCGRRRPVARGPRGRLAAALDV
ncbi:hypothetical protein F4801DRAFT_32098 [Xylaria longipes]|nr:hypothetical protein F4801DRAFT_32098 [Xylaria longipes]